VQTTAGVQQCFLSRGGRNVSLHLYTLSFNVLVTHPSQSLSTYLWETWFFIFELSSHRLARSTDVELLDISHGDIG